MADRWRVDRLARRRHGRHHDSRHVSRLDRGNVHDRSDRRPVDGGSGFSGVDRAAGVEFPCTASHHVICFQTDRNVPVAAQQRAVSLARIVFVSNGVAITHEAYAYDGASTEDTCVVTNSPLCLDE